MLLVEIRMDEILKKQKKTRKKNQIEPRGAQVSLAMGLFGHPSIII